MIQWSTREAVVVVFLGLLFFVLKDRKFANKLSTEHLVIGVLSSRDHFSQREIVRQTWASHLHHIPNSKLVFVLGETDCHLHPVDRKSVYSCQEWTISERDVTDSRSETFVKLGGTIGGQSWNKFSCNNGLGFRILHSIVAEAFSIRSDVIKRLHRTLIILQDADEVLESVIVDEKKCTEEDGMCVVKLETSLLLPKGFEGEVLIQMGAEDEGVCGENILKDNGGDNMTCQWTENAAVDFKYVRTRRDVVSNWKSSICSAVSIKFRVTEVENLRRHVDSRPVRTKEWKEHIEENKLKIIEEQRKNQDLLLLPFQDIYSNLPQKTKNFLMWVTQHKNTTFVMKVDDDTFVNVRELKNLLAGEKGEDLMWWSYFHFHRSVPIYGKWADTRYPGLTYPTFPSGAGYLMTGSLAEAIATIGPSLPLYGGEDVSVGIWVTVSAQDVKMVDVPCWLPHPRCPKSVLETQLSETQMKIYWDSYLQER
ncbi:UDP-GalNAc:beta-1,3-N-acetylgalactosaminyltransferase 2-like isoform X2 [Penaeus japonicus]|uniref:UDP-GalNAc:beta-1, 3-N-acetylgalactosaminyltransferase 2-like isoform X2 n=1 Tax=Penaeus japonicus TaxID=27405 RepID=UPI001C711124|nr:UDP-GalNAc:beta-1,3-N-acetylgalactosaminyltransferase 2-like isoform X2 [Penaeus japonicus]